MTILAIIWSWMFLSCLILGSATALLIRKVTGYEITHLFSRIFIGFGILIVYAQAFSIFYKVGNVAQLFLLLICVAFLFLFYKNPFFLRILWKKPSISLLIVAGLCIALSAFIAAKSILHPDSYLYHAQAIRWIEEYGVVNGLGNLHNRFAYNSSAFCLTALFSFSSLLGQSFRPINGFIMCMLLLCYTYSWTTIKKQLFSISTMIKVASICYLFTVLWTISSPSSDEVTTIFIFLLLNRWFELIEDDQTDTTPFAIICIGFLVAVSLKISVVFFLLLTLYPAVLLIKQRKWNQILLFISVGFICILPFLVRNVIISGYLIYPYTAIDIFDFDWKMPASIVQYDYEEIQLWGRDFYMTVDGSLPFDEWLLAWKSAYHASILEWFPSWFLKKDLSTKLLIAASLVSDFLLITVGGWISWKKKTIWNSYYSCIVPVFVMLFWLTSAPLLRYGCAFLILTIAVLTGFFFTHILSPVHAKYYNKIAATWSILSLLYFAIWNLTNIGDSHKMEPELNAFIQTDYSDQYSYDTTLLSDITIYYGSYNSYDVFPATPYKKRIAFIELRGDTLEDGFRVKEEYDNDSYLDMYR
ncbi:MAG: hypothetical protein R3Y67_02645 [Eubacteriales bacterium]